MTTILLIAVLVGIFWRPVFLLVLLIALGVALSGCTTTRSTIPGQLLTCAPQPASPQASTQRDVALYIVDLAVAGDDCRTKLGAVRNIITPERP
jgi:hypothetical protein